ncbi:hypothetical protein PPERSA_00531 [Pseudocohnilembus persalinus]|uniref:Uncharacterized protein n=1 Tax=Pseudocohnilembus persalinus TaxID=266149 RepID=A0A0V0QHX5_PSEPJ|nr:hypothetical protein PPERSA_00531 [Pseudocohnilembus persalinus]|eukprot:KRX01821.1 hypothetical protein PPERSA_00531 [Pseudocohnilembus persalinus]
MEHIKRSIQKNEQYRQNEAYANKLSSISRVTNWHESKVKYDNNNKKKIENELIKQEVKCSQRELFQARNIRLKQLYEQEAEQWEQQLAEKGLAIYKSKP